MGKLAPTKRATTVKAAAADLKKISMELTHDDGEYRVNFKGGAEATAYYTNDLSDAILTAAVMRGHSAWKGA